MQKRFFIYIIISHLLVPFSLILPIHRLKIGTSESMSFINIFEYLKHNRNLYINIFLLIFIFCELLGIVNSFFGVFGKITHISIRNSFALGFSSAILAAIFLSNGSYIFFLVCAFSFLTISYFSLRLLKMEK